MAYSKRIQNALEIFRANKGNILLTIVLFALACPPSFATEIVVTLDDHPMPDSRLFSVNERVERYCRALERHACQAAFFCIGFECLKVLDLSCLARLNHAGHYLANHSFKHKHLSSMSLDEFQEELKATEAVLHPFSQFRKWFRFPYLDYGNRGHLGGSKEKFLAACAILEKDGYREGFVTINTFDWHINYRLQEAARENKKVNYSKLRMAYMYLLNEWCNHYIAHYKNLFDKDITHVLLLHANDLNALFLEDILEMINEKGWKVVSPEQAFTDPLWRKMLIERHELFPEKPASLNERSIDQVLEAYCVFSEK